LDEGLIWHTVRHDLGALRGVAAVELERPRLALENVAQLQAAAHIVELLAAA
jgi:hypothetical protein